MGPLMVQDKSHATASDCRDNRSLRSHVRSTIRQSSGRAGRHPFQPHRASEFLRSACARVSFTRVAAWNAEAVAKRHSRVADGRHGTLTHLRDVLGDDAYESLAHKGQTMTTVATVAYAYDQIDQARAELDAVSK
jgi:hypothetical protein